MRTKTLLTAAALAAGALTSMAQSNVYSLNVVGYYNVTVPSGGYALVANQLDSGTNGLNQVLPGLPGGALVLKYHPNIFDYVTDFTDGTAWFDNNTGNPTTTTVSPGEGFFINNPNNTPLTVTFVGQVRQGAGLTVNLTPGYAMVSTITPQNLVLDPTNQFPLVSGMLYLAYNPAIFDYVTDFTDGTGWFDNNTGNPVTVQPAVGQGYFINNPDASTHAWTRNFTVQ